MKVVVFVKATRESEAGEMPSEEMLLAMGNYNEELVKAGIMVDGDGLKASSHGFRVQFSGGERNIVDGPFPEVSQLVAGYWIWQVSSIDEAKEWALKCPKPHRGDAELEIRPFIEAEDFGDAFTPELQAKEEELRATVANRQGT